MRKNKIYFALTSCLLTSFCLAVFARSPLPSSDRKSNKLHLVKKIYVEEIDGVANKHSVNLYIKQQLRNAGFTTTDKQVDADAILTGTFYDVITLDGDGSEPPPRSYYEFQLTSPNKVVIWKSKIKVPARLNDSRIETYVAEKLASKLFAAWRKSAKKAGLISN